MIFSFAVGHSPLVGATLVVMKNALPDPGMEHKAFCTFLWTK